MFASFSLEYAHKTQPHSLASTILSRNHLKSILSHHHLPASTSNSALKFISLSSFHKTTLSPPKKKQHDEKVLIRSEWRALHNCQMFQDYLFLRDARAMKLLKLLQEDTDEEDQDKELVFMSEEQEKEYLEQQRLAKMEKLREMLQSNANLTQSVQEQQKKVINKSLLKDALELLEVISKKIVTCQLEQVQPVCEELMKRLADAGVVNFYLISIFLNSFIQQIYGRRVQSYSNWKRFLRICNVNGELYQKYKLVGYKHISNCCLDLNKHEKAMIYLKKMLKLAWFTENKDFEILAYDMIAVVLYYMQDLERAIFFHDKFVNGDYENKNSNARYLGQQSYKLSQKNSFSEDDYDLEVIVHQNNLQNWHKEQRRREQEKDLWNKNDQIRKTGASFAKSDFRKKQKNKEKILKWQISQFKKKAQVTLGPIYRKNEESDINKMQTNSIQYSQNFAQKK